MATLITPEIIAKLVKLLDNFVELGIDAEHFSEDIILAALQNLTGSDDILTIMGDISYDDFCDALWTLSKAIAPEDKAFSTAEEAFDALTR